MFDEQIEKENIITVLGKTFNSDDERRAYFREELRKKLPELKNIEGFPIGEDEDIINLSTLRIILPALTHGSVILLLNGKLRKQNWKNRENVLLIL